MPPPIVRARRTEDIATLVDVLQRQQPHSRYPFRWPLPFPAEQFIVRETEEQAWVAEQDGVPVGHVSLTSVEDDELGAIWSAGVGLPIARLACVSVLFVDHARQGQGLGRLLMDTAVSAARAQGRTPVLDVVDADSTAARVYRHLGWVEVGSARPEWLADSEPPVLMMVRPDTGPFFHGTKADLAVGDLITPGFRSNYRPEVIMNHVYFTAQRDGAGLAAELATGEAPPRVYAVVPIGAFEDDPNVTDQKFPGNPTRSYRSDQPLRIIAEVEDWTRPAPEALQGWRARIAAIRDDERGEIIN